MSKARDELQGVPVRKRGWGELRQDILKMLIERRDPLSPRTLAKLVESDRRGVQQCLVRLVEQGLVETVARGLYAPTGRYVDGKLVA